MHKFMLSFLSFVLVFVLFANCALGDSIDLTKMNDEELTDLYLLVRREMIDRKLISLNTYTFPSGQYIVGEDIEPGTYTITCVNTEGDSIGSMYSSLGGMFDDEASGYFNALGGMMSSISYTSVKVLGAYGAVIKSVQLKSGESVVLILNENTALEISSGSCMLEPNGV